jgi:toxin ParE1/3/4
MKLKFQLSELAQKDLENIWEYTYSNWSVKQADKYIKQIIEQVEFLCHNAEVGRLIPAIKPKHRMYRVNSHLIIYKFDSHFLKVDRVLHERMDNKNRI